MNFYFKQNTKFFLQILFNKIILKICIFNSHLNYNLKKLKV
jgi:hypothetical protein